MSAWKKIKPRKRIFAGNSNLTKLQLNCRNLLSCSILNAVHLCIYYIFHHSFSGLKNTVSCQTWGFSLIFTYCFLCLRKSPILEGFWDNGSRSVDPVAFESISHLRTRLPGQELHCRQQEDGGEGRLWLPRWRQPQCIIAGLHQKFMVSHV